MPKLKPTAATARATSLTVAEVEDPNTGKPARVITTRASGLDHMRHHGRLTDAEAAAGAAFARLFEIAHHHGVRSVDFGRVRVDGGRRSFGPTPAALNASERLEAIRAALGPRAYWLLEQVAGHGRTLSDVAGEFAKQAGTGQRASENYCAERLRESLTDLANLFGAKGPARAAMRAERCDYLPGFGTA